jgi:hypothetical protein
LMFQKLTFQHAEIVEGRFDSEIKYYCDWQSNVFIPSNSIQFKITDDFVV